MHQLWNILNKFQIYSVPISNILKLFLIFSTCSIQNLFLIFWTFFKCIEFKMCAPCFKYSEFFSNILKLILNLPEYYEPLSKILNFFHIFWIVPNIFSLFQIFRTCFKYFEHAPDVVFFYDVVFIFCLFISNVVFISIS